MVYPAKVERADIVREARALVERDGAEGLSLRRLAEALGVRAPSLYHHFPQKAAVVRAVAAESAAEGGAVMARAAAEHAGDPYVQIRAMAYAFRAWARAHPHLYALYAADTPADERAAVPDLEVGSAPLRATLAALVGPDRAVPVAQAAWALVHGFLALEIAGQMREGDPARGFDTAIDLLLAGIRSMAEVYGYPSTRR